MADERKTIFITGAASGIGLATARYFAAQRWRVGGFDVDTAALLANGLDRELLIVWLPKPNPSEIESTDLDFGPLLSGQCDVQLSIPGPAAVAGRAIALSEPYYGAGFELIPAQS